MSNLWFDMVPLEWFEFQYHFIDHAFTFCAECDLYGEKFWGKDDPHEYHCVQLHDRWTFYCDDCWRGWH